MREGGYRLQGIYNTDSMLLKVTVVIAVYNGELYLEQTLNSVLQQTYQNIELIVIDGGSTDTTVNILNNYNDEIAYWKSEPDEGIYDAWNKAVTLAAGDWIAFVGADDILLPNTIEQYIKHIEVAHNPDLQFVSGKVQFVTNDLKPKTLFGGEWKWNSHKREMRIAHVGAFHHKSLFERYGLFDKRYKIAGDYEFLLRPKDKLNAAFIDQVTVLMRFEGTSNSNRKVFEEVMTAKIETAERNRLICTLEYIYMLFKFYSLKIIRP